MPQKPDNTVPLFSNYISRQIQVGKLFLGAHNPVRIQSMVNTSTLNTLATVNQIRELSDAGCEIVRLTVQDRKEAGNLPVIKKELIRQGLHIPLVADIHFRPELAEIAAHFVEKVRINPGNYVDRNREKPEYSGKDTALALEKINERLSPLLKICKQKGTAIRIGVNHGSLSERILVMYGNTPEGLVESAMEFVRICHREGFDNLTLSLKASQVPTMIEANKILVEKMIAGGFNYPIHLGVTEAGSGEEARIKSIAGIGSLLAMGIGDTVRVSLTENPVNEIPVAKELVKYYGRNKKAINETIRHATAYKLQPGETLKNITGQRFPVVVTGISEKAELRYDAKQGTLVSGANRKCNIQPVQEFPVLENRIVKISYPGLSSGELRIRATVDITLMVGQTSSAGLYLENGETEKSDHLVDLSLKILQAAGKRFSHAEFIACPSCGRTRFNIFKKLEAVKSKTAHLKGLKIAVMGCIVNGPGEMGDADYGFMGSGPGKVTLYKSQEPVLKNIDESEAVNALINLIKKGGDWVVPEKRTTFFKKIL